MMGMMGQGSRWRSFQLIFICLLIFLDQSDCSTSDMECTAGSHNCAPEATCTSTGGSFTCECPATGYRSYDDGTFCDPDECVEGQHTCGSESKCENTRGSFICSCPSEGCSANLCPTGYHHFLADNWQKGSLDQYTDVGFIEDCAALCTSENNCLAFQHSPTTKICHLSHEIRKNQHHNYEDYVFCQKDLFSPALCDETDIYLDPIGLETDISITVGGDGVEDPRDCQKRCLGRLSEGIRFFSFTPPDRCDCRAIDVSRSLWKGAVSGPVECDATPVPSSTPSAGETATASSSFFWQGALLDHRSFEPQELDPLSRPLAASLHIAREQDSLNTLEEAAREQFFAVKVPEVDARFATMAGSEYGGFPQSCVPGSLNETSPSCAFLFRDQGGEFGPFVPVEASRSSCVNLHDLLRNGMVRKDYIPPEVLPEAEGAVASSFTQKSGHRKKQQHRGNGEGAPGDVDEIGTPLPFRSSSFGKNGENADDDQAYLFSSLRLSGRTVVELFEEKDCRYERTEKTVDPSTFSSMARGEMPEEGFLYVNTHTPAHVWRFSSGGPDEVISSLSSPVYLRTSTSEAGVQLPWRACACPLLKGGVDYPELPRGVYRKLWDLMAKRSGVLPTEMPSEGLETGAKVVGLMKVLLRKSTPVRVRSALVGRLLDLAEGYRTQSEETRVVIFERVHRFFLEEAREFLQLPWPDPCSHGASPRAVGVRSIRVHTLPEEAGEEAGNANTTEAVEKKTSGEKDAFGGGLRYIPSSETLEPGKVFVQQLNRPWDCIEPQEKWRGFSPTESVNGAVGSPHSRFPFITPFNESEPFIEMDPPDTDLVTPEESTVSFWTFVRERTTGGSPDVPVGVLYFGNHQQQQPPPSPSPQDAETTPETEGEAAQSEPGTETDVSTTPADTEQEGGTDVPTSEPSEGEPPASFLQKVETGKANKGKRKQTPEGEEGGEAPVQGNKGEGEGEPITPQDGEEGEGGNEGDGPSSTGEEGDKPPTSNTTAPSPPSSEFVVLTWKPAQDNKKPSFRLLYSNEKNNFSKFEVIRDLREPSGTQKESVLDKWSFFALTIQSQESITSICLTLDSEPPQRVDSICAFRSPTDQALKDSREVGSCGCLRFQVKSSSIFSEGVNLIRVGENRVGAAEERAAAVATGVTMETEEKESAFNVYSSNLIVDNGVAEASQLGSIMQLSDPDECLLETHSCEESAHQLCVNVVGSFSCVCKGGFMETWVDAEVEESEVAAEEEKGSEGDVEGTAVQIGGPGGGGEGVGAGVNKEEKVLKCVKPSQS
uniref:EGF-like domain-containing protein n=1 Tax=Chromera velia CCMP2878 TaxID=1169474 RepID=A0A0G4HYV2_9ALVE|eukprot:Cvel_9580.t1-p1 / transcript=Cvel_9580.t1 / gene=Cvel_9580 / organism=Chromera_velia_CCMP2878 / gene_product=Fibrillin-1, putative / transcript_product=Fibrillin-1, putative / location=Cvel_scaffold555:65297-72369(-) / protein_length=1280 / sequence_SO=supercontig / SO=protein_coding / is_pseudo=false